MQVVCNYMKDYHRHGDKLKLVIQYDSEDTVAKTDSTQLGVDYTIDVPPLQDNFLSQFEIIFAKVRDVIMEEAYKRHKMSVFEEEFLKDPDGYRDRAKKRVQSGFEESVRIRHR